MKVDPALYQHVNPEQVGNSRRMLVSEMSGRALVEMKAAELGIPATDPTLLRKVTNAVKEREARGYTYDAADASFALLVRYLQGNLPHYFEVESCWFGNTSRVLLPRLLAGLLQVPRLPNTCVPSVPRSLNQGEVYGLSLIHISEPTRPY